jgi:hypothetical protein
MTGGGKVLYFEKSDQFSSVSGLQKRCSPAQGWALVIFKCNGSDSDVPPGLIACSSGLPQTEQ